MGFLRNKSAAKPLDFEEKTTATATVASSAGSISSNGSSRSGRNRNVRNTSAASPLPDTTGSTSICRKAKKCGSSYSTLHTGDTVSISTAGSDSQNGSVRSGNSLRSGSTKDSRHSRTSKSSKTSVTSSIMSPRTASASAAWSPAPRVPRPPSDGGSKDKRGVFKSPKFGMKLACQPLDISPTPANMDRDSMSSPKLKNNQLTLRLSNRNRSASSTNVMDDKKKQVTFSTEFAIYSAEGDLPNSMKSFLPPPVVAAATQHGSSRRESWGVKELSFEISSIDLWVTSEDIEMREQVDAKLLSIMNESSTSHMMSVYDDRFEKSCMSKGEWEGDECIRGLESRTTDGSQRAEHSRRAAREAVFEEQHHSNGDAESISKAYILCTQLALHRAKELALQDETYVMEHVLV